jgi:hypothetical protein
VGVLVVDHAEGVAGGGYTAISSATVHRWRGHRKRIRASISRSPDSNRCDLRLTKALGRDPQKNQAITILQSNRTDRAAVIDRGILRSKDVFETSVTRGADES